MKRWRSDEYRKFVSSLTCARCKCHPLNTCHHIKGIGHMSGAGLKAPDQYSMPLCQECHDELHRKSHPDVVRCQWEWVARTQGLFIERMVDSIGHGEVDNLIKLVNDANEGWD